MKRTILNQLFLLVSLISFGQTSNSLPVSNDILKKEIESISNDRKINADSASTILSSWNKYPEINNVKRWYLFLYKDSVFGIVPLRIFIPENYRTNVPSPAILILHGAVGLSSFKDAYNDTAADEDLFYSYFAKRNFIVIRPFADVKIRFDWVVDWFNGKNNPTFQTLTAIISKLKTVLNIDDNKIFALGHSDGSDGTFALEVYKPSMFAGFIAYNSMLKNLFTYDMYLRNTLNRPLYLVHSDLDDLRPIQQTRLIMKILDSMHSPVVYKEYIGYQHYDKHLQMDLPFSYKWMKGINRNPFQKSITWEMSDQKYNTCDWLRISQFDPALTGATWQTEINTNTYYKKDKTYSNSLYYDLNKSAAIKANYNNNVFEINTSRITEIELLISPLMVNLLNPVVVKINGKEVFDKKVMADKAFLINNFTSTFDRKTLWVNAIKLKIN